MGFYVYLLYFVLSSPFELESLIFAILMDMGGQGSPLKFYSIILLLC